MINIINRRGSKAATRALKRSGRPQRTASPKKSSKKAESVRRCDTCGNAGWDTMDKVAACNCCEHQEFYTPAKSRENELE